MRVTLFRTLIVLMLIAGSQTGYAEDGFSITGKLLYQAQQRPCDRCEVSLENYGAPIDTVFSDSVGNFSFHNLREGTYTVKVSLQGFEPIEQRIEVSQFFEGGMTLIMLAPRAVHSDDRDAEDVVHIATYLKRYPEKAVNLYKKADKNARKQKFKEAISQLEEAIKIAPDFYNAHNYLGLLYKAEGRMDDAAKEFEIAETLNTTSPEPLINLTGLYIDGDQPDRAIEAGEEAIKRDNRSAPAFFNLGLALYRASKFILAQEALQKALSLAPKMGQARLALANVFVKLRNFVGLREQLQTYLQENPKAKERAEVEQFLGQFSEEEAKP